MTLGAPPFPLVVSRLDAKLVNQGAEGRIFSTTFLGNPTIIKERFKKSYRHPILDEKITSKRVTQEIRTILRCRKSGIDTPALYFADPKDGLLFIEEIDGVTTREAFCGDAAPWTETSKQIAQNIGKTLAKMHAASIIHGDLTTSNMMIRKGSTAITLIDFGLSTSSTLVEDRAVDLYVLERAMLSTHIDSGTLFEEVLNSYASALTKKNNTIKKLDEVRQRGRKKLAFG